MAWHWLPRSLLIGCILTACRSPSLPPLEERQAAAYGPAPTAPETLLAATLKPLLKDAHSFTLEVVRGPVKAWWPERGYGRYGYGVCAYVTVKKRDGRSASPEFYYFHLAHDAVVAMVAPSPYLPERGAEACRTMEERSV